MKKFRIIKTVSLSGRTVYEIQKKSFLFGRWVDAWDGLRWKSFSSLDEAKDNLKFVYADKRLKEVEEVVYST